MAYRCRQRQQQSTQTVKVKEERKNTSLERRIEKECFWMTTDDSQNMLLLYLTLALCLSPNFACLFSCSFLTLNRSTFHFGMTKNEGKKLRWYNHKWIVVNRVLSFFYQLHFLLCSLFCAWSRTWWVCVCLDDVMMAVVPLLVFVLSSRTHNDCSFYRCYQTAEIKYLIFQFDAHHRCLQKDKKQQRLANNAFLIKTFVLCFACPLWNVDFPHKKCKNNEADDDDDGVGDDKNQTGNSMVSNIPHRQSERKRGE